MRRALRWSVMIGLLCLTTATACSKDTATPGGPIATTPPLTKEALLSRANEICAAADKQITELADSAPLENNDGTKAQDQLRQVVDKVAPIAQNAINDLRSLTPPAEDAAKVQAGLAKMQATLDAAKANPSNQFNPIGLPDDGLYNYGLSSCFTKANGG